MTSSLPKPLQNDFDTVVIDLLSRYSLDNKSVRYFVQSVAQQVRDINRLPRLLKEAKPSRGTAAQNGATTDSGVADNKEKPGFLTRLQGYQSAWNRGSLVGVFLEYLKNKKEDQQAKLATPVQTPSTKTTKEPSEQQPIAQTVKTEKEVIESFTDKITETKADILERVVNNLQKIQEVFSSPGLLGATKNILTAYEKPELAVPVTPIASSTSYTAPTYDTSATNNSTVNTTNTAVTNNESIELTQGEARAQKQDLLKEEQVIILGGINDKGARDLKKIISSIFEEQSELFFGSKAGGLLGGMDSEVTDSDYEGPGLLDSYLQYKGIRSLFGGKGGKSLGGGKKGAKARAKARAQGRGYQGTKLSQKPSAGKPTTPKPKPTAKPGRFIPKPGAGGLLRGIGTLGLGMLADWGGQMAGGEIAKGIYGEEKTTAAYEEYGADIFGLFRASYDATKAIGEAKEARERSEKIEKQTIPLDIKAMMFGYKDLKDFGESVASGKEKRRMYWDEQKQAVVVIQPNKTQEIHKFVYGKGFLGKPDIIGTDGQKISSKPMPTQNPDIKPLPPNSKPIDVEKPGATPLILPSTPLTPNTTKVISPGISQTPAIPLTPDTTKAIPPVPSSITETHITNNNADKKTLADIASNTDKTNQSITTLSNAVFKLAQVFDAKTMTGGSNVIVNSNGQAKEYTSTSQIAANNVDTTRKIRQQFLAALS